MIEFFSRTLSSLTGALIGNAIVYCFFYRKQSCLFNRINELDDFHSANHNRLQYKIEKLEKRLSEVDIKLSKVHGLYNDVSSSEKDISDGDPIVWLPLSELKDIPEKYNEI